MTGPAHGAQPEAFAPTYAGVDSSENVTYASPSEPYAEAHELSAFADMTDAATSSLLNTASGFKGVFSNLW